MKLSRQEGTMSIFLVAFLLPLMFLLLTLSLDLNTYFMDREKTQTAIDETAKYAYRFLPYQTQAIAAAQDYGARFGDLTHGLTVNATTDWVELAVRRQSPLVFAQLFGLSTASDVQGLLDINIRSRVRGVPIDAYVVMDASPYMAPDVLGNIAWGNDVEWPTAQYMNNAWWFDPTQVNLNSRVLTQQCFNPTFSALKQATIRVVDYLSGYSLNQVGVGFYTGDANEPIQSARDTDRLYSLPASALTHRESAFVEASSAYSDNRYCAAAAQTEGYTSQYLFPNRDQGLPVRRPTNVPVMIDPVTATINGEYLDYLEAREVIWSQIARGSANGNTPDVLLVFMDKLFSAPVIQARGGLIDRALKIGIFFAGDVPRINGVRFGEIGQDSDLRQSMRDKLQPYVAMALRSDIATKVKLYYVILQNPEVPPLADLPQNLQEFFNQTLTEQGVSQERLEIKVIYSTNAVTLVDGLLKHLVLTNLTTVQSS